MPDFIENVYQIPEAPDNPFRLGRNVLHDVRSRQFRVPRAEVIESKNWERAVPIFDQGNLGSCTGNAAAGSAATGFAMASGLTVMPRSLGGDKLPITEDTAVAVYSRATAIDPFSGTWPPTDTGSNGVSVAKVLQEWGVIDEYRHAFGLQDLLSALQTGSAIMGSNWYSSMFSPVNGLVSINGYVAGGHEFTAVAVDTRLQLIRFANSWGSSWGDRGYFSMTYATVERLLAEDGDVTVFRPKAPEPPLPLECSWIQTLLKWLSLGLYEPNCQ